MAKHDIMHIERTQTALKTLEILTEDFEILRATNELAMNEVDATQAEHLRSMNNTIDQIDVLLSRMNTWWYDREEEINQRKK